MIALVVLLIVGTLVIAFAIQSVYLDFEFGWTLLILFLGMGMVFGAAIPMATIVHNRHVEHCHERGGHIHHLYRDYVCLSPDGRII